MTNETQMTNDEKVRSRWERIHYSDFVIPSSFVIRASSFQIR